MNAREHYQAGNLDEAVAAATQEVKRHPTDTSPRGLLCELLCFAGDFERADAQLDAIGHQDPQSMVGVAMLRQLIRAERSRQECFAEGRVPEFIEPPPEYLRRHLEAAICLRQGDLGEASRLLDEAESLRPRLAGTCDGEQFDDIRDIDDLTACFFEVLTSNGKYYWIPMESVESVEFRPPERPRDLLWRRVHMVARGGADGEVFIPALYPGSHAEPDDRVRLGRLTDWRGGEGAPIRGIGQRIYVIDEQDRPLLELSKLKITSRKPGVQDG
jgi:type VI secretion system protein ImpE